MFADCDATFIKSAATYAAKRLTAGARIRSEKSSSDNVFSAVPKETGTFACVATVKDVFCSLVP